MALLEDKIHEIPNKALRESILAEVDKLKSKKKFGLVFEEHIPELTPIYGAPVKPRATVAEKGKTLGETYTVEHVSNGIAKVTADAGGNKTSFPVNSLVVVKNFGAPIYPSLVSVDRVENGGDAPYHILIEADNYHALQLMEYLYAGKVDCVYIDPPYNTGARDWKYNNDFVDRNDSWRHSKWLSFMEKRLILAKRLLKEDGVLIVTIDEHEVYHLGLLLEQVFPTFLRHMVTIVNNPKGTGKLNFARVDEYAIFCVPNIGRSIISGKLTGQVEPTENEEGVEDADNDDGMVDEEPDVNGEGLPFPEDESDQWELRHARRRGGESSYRHQRPNQFYPIYVDPSKNKIIRAGDTLPLGKKPKFDRANGLIPIWPIDTEGNDRCWRFIPSTMQSLIDAGCLVLGRFHEQRGTWTINIWEKKPTSRKLKTVWWDSKHDAGTHGTTFLNNILGRRAAFPFPKSVYAVKDCLAAVVRERPNALVVDFFAGSGTTLNAVNLLNLADNGNRQCILVTNNELNEKQAKLLAKKGYNPGDAEWEKHGICRSITFPRSKYTILGRRDDRTELPGEYATGRVLTREASRNIRQIAFVDSATLDTLQKKKQLVSLIDGIPQSKVVDDQPFVVDQECNASVLFNPERVEEYIASLKDQKHITDFHVVTSSTRKFGEIRARITETLGTYLLTEEEKRPIKDGLSANLEYFRLNFLDPNEVEVGRQFEAILPILWMMSGAKGKRPMSKGGKPYLIPEGCQFAVLIRDTHFKEFKEKIRLRDDLTHVFLVTDSEEAFFEMKGEIKARNVRMLYKDYLDNFKINMGKI